MNGGATTWLHSAFFSACSGIRQNSERHLGLPELWRVPLRTRCLVMSPTVVPRDVLSGSKG
jgi:hypothetical protein